MAGLSFPVFAAVAVVVLGGTFIVFGPKADKILAPMNMIGAFAVMMVLGAIWWEIGERTPIVNTFLGGGAIATIFGMAALVHWKILPKPAIVLITDFTGKMGFLDFYIAALITGSILGMSRKLLISAFSRYIPVILLGVGAALGGVALVGALIGYGWKEAVLYIGVPIMGGGMGAGAVPMSKIYAGSTGTDPAKMLSMMIPAVALGNAMSIVAGGLIDRVGKAHPEWTGNGQLMPMKDDTAAASAKEAGDELTLPSLGIGLLLSTSFFILGLAIAAVFPKIHSYAWMILSVALVKALGIMPREYEIAARNWYQFIATNLTACLLVGVGVAYTNLGQIISAFTWQYLLLVFTVLMGAIAGTWVGGKMVGFYPIESSITAGLCMANMGGTGDVAVLSAAKRMNAMPFAQISSRIGGAIMLILGGILISIL
jgi:CCS family citrate carrier protein